MAKIYEIVDCNELRYVGSTEQKYLSKRLSGHKGDKKSGKNCSSRKLDLDNCDINLLEECDVSVKKEREQYWMDKLDCVNYQRANGMDYDRNRKKCRDRQRYVRSWGGTYNRYENNLLQIDVNLFQ